MGELITPFGDRSFGRALTLYSEGTRIAATLHKPAGVAPPGGFPGLLLCHGWGGLMSQLAPYTERFAAAGFAVMTFDYRGWGTSDGRLIAERDSPSLLQAGEQTLRVRVLREIVDPIDQTTDALNCLTALAAEEDVDAARIGIWGTSYGAGHAVFLAGTNPEIQAVVAQVGGFGLMPRFHDYARARAIEKVRGLLDPPVPQGGLDSPPGLRGTADIARMLHHAPLAAAANVRAPTLIIDVDAEELVDSREHGEAAYNIIRRHAVCEYKTLPGTHYDIYGSQAEASVTMALEWFTTYLARFASAQA